MTRSLRSKPLRAALFNDAGGRCRMCGDELAAGWHADHVVPWSRTHETNVFDMQALCPKCNGRKGATMIKARKFYTDVRTVAMGRAAAGVRTMTALVECGAGKSSLPSGVAFDLNRSGHINGLIWVVPRVNLAKQAERSMHRDSFAWKLVGLTPSEAKRFEILALEGNTSGIGALRSCFGYALSYGALHSGLDLHRDFVRSRGGKVLLIGDEIQMAGKGKPWGVAYEAMQHICSFSLQMSGDLDRPGGERVAGVTYGPSPTKRPGWRINRDVVQTDVVYPINDALTEKVILPIDFAFGSGSVTYYKGADKREIPSLAEAGDDARDAVWAALNSDYARQLLRDCVASWRAHRKDGILPTSRGRVERMADAQLMVVCGNQVQAREVRAFMCSDLGFSEREVGIAIQDENDPGETLREFCAGKLPAIVTVAMAYIGTDAPRVSHLCCLTYYRSPSWLHQMLARAWRTSEGKTYCVAFCPDDPDFMEAIKQIRLAQQIGALADRDDDGNDGDGDDGTPSRRTERDPVIAEKSTLLSVRNEYQIRGAQDPEAHTVAPSESDARQALLALGFSDEQVARMIAAAAAPVVIDVMSDRIKHLDRDLNKYQRDTAKKVSQIRGTKPDWAEPNKQLVIIMGGKKRDQLTEQDKIEAFAKYAPLVRESLIEEALLDKARRL